MDLFVLPDDILTKIMTFVLGTQKDYVQVHLVCKKMKNYKPLCSLQGDFTDKQIRAILASMNAEGRQGWKRSIQIVGNFKGWQPSIQIMGNPNTVWLPKRKCKITVVGLMLLMEFQWVSMSFRHINISNAVFHRMAYHVAFCESLQVLEVKHCDGWTWDYVFEVCEDLKKELRLCRSCCDSCRTDEAMRSYYSFQCEPALKLLGSEYYTSQQSELERLLGGKEDDDVHRVKVCILHWGRQWDWAKDFDDEISEMYMRRGRREGSFYISLVKNIWRQQI